MSTMNEFPPVQFLVYVQSARTYIVVPWIYSTRMLRNAINRHTLTDELAWDHYILRTPPRPLLVQVQRPIESRHMPEIGAESSDTGQVSDCRIYLPSVGRE